MIEPRAVTAVKVGRAVYRVRYKRLLPELWGRMFFSTRSIQIDDSQSGADMADTLLHEILHAVWDARKLKPRTTEERAVTEISSGLVAVFRDNPGLLLHLEQLIKEAR